MTYRAGWLCALIIGGFCLPGCGLMQTTKSVARESMKPLKLRPNDRRDTTNDTEDEWSSVGRTANTVRVVEKDNDPLRKYLLSPKAMSIERNFGIE